VANKALSRVAVIADKAALTLRAIVLRTARSLLKSLWRGLYAAIARGVALVVAPRRTRASVYLTGSLASGEPLQTARALDDLSRRDRDIGDDDLVPSICSQTGVNGVVS
jgi:hypothetical protein